uniref:Reverse transcriptase Ty1/copia-type domain-containing protein n=1 Tax=Aegilops tauschii subsp. strangulata TaxID=200361 RepID=A0A453D0W1_AEGTS
MTTRAKRGFAQPRRLFTLTTSDAISPLLATYKSALKDPHWHNAMLDEFHALVKNKTWCLVPRPAGVNVVTGKWIFRHKLHPDGSLARYKARGVLRGFTQQERVDYTKTFSPVVKPATIRVVLSIATAHAWPIHQLDVKNAFLHGDLREIVYCAQPAGFVDPSHPNHVCLLQKSLYGLKQAPRTWFLWFKSFILSLGFVSSRCDTSLFILHRGSSTAYLLLYVDDIILTANNSSTLSSVITSLKAEFAMSDLGDIHHFLGVNVTRNSSGLFLYQQQYLLEILDRANMLNCNPISTPIDTKAKPSAFDGDPLSNPTHYRSLAGALKYLTLTRPDISYVVQQACLFMHAPR